MLTNLYTFCVHLIVFVWPGPVQPGVTLLADEEVWEVDLFELELDGFDETLCPVDFLQEGMIVDNDLNSILVWPLKNGVTLHALVDACHSGTILDLSYVYKQEK